MKVLVLRKCTEERTSNFVEASDWDGKPGYGSGLRGLLWGAGSWGLEIYGTLFQVIEADDSDVIEFAGKCKFKCGNVLYTGDQQGAISLLKSHPNYPQDNLLNYDIQFGVQFAIAGRRATLVGGEECTLIAGEYSILCGGFNSVLTSLGDFSVLRAGPGSMFTGGYGSVFLVPYWNGSRLVSRVKNIDKKAAGKTFQFRNDKFMEVKEDVKQTDQSRETGGRAGGSL